MKRQRGSNAPAVTISLAPPPAPATKTRAAVPLPSAATSMQAESSWQASYPAKAMRLCRSYSPAREASNFRAASIDVFKGKLQLFVAKSIK